MGRGQGQVSPPRHPSHPPATRDEAQDPQESPGALERGGHWREVGEQGGRETGWGEYQECIRVDIARG